MFDSIGIKSGSSNLKSGSNGEILSHSLFNLHSRFLFSILNFSSSCNLKYSNILLAYNNFSACKFQNLHIQNMLILLIFF